MELRLQTADGRLQVINSQLISSADGRSCCVAVIKLYKIHLSSLFTSIGQTQQSAHLINNLVNCKWHYFFSKLIDSLIHYFVTNFFLQQ